MAAYARVFNTSLIFSGLILVVFLGGLGYFINDFLGYVAAAVGVFTGFSCALVGALPMNNLKRHIPVALSFFNGGLVLTIIFGILILTDQQGRLSSWILAPTLVTIASFAGYLFLPKMLDPKRPWTLDPTKFKRPKVMSITTLEWLVFVSIIAWIVSISLDLILS